MPFFFSSFALVARFILSFAMLTKTASAAQWASFLAFAMAASLAAHLAMLLHVAMFASVSAAKVAGMTALPVLA